MTKLTYQEILNILLMWQKQATDDQAVIGVNDTEWHYKDGKFWALQSVIELISNE